MLAIVLLAAQQPPTPVRDARITVHFTAALPDGTVLADTERRGMAFTFLMDQDTVEPFWHQAVRSLRVGESRTLSVPASQTGNVIQGDPPVTLTVRLVKVAPL